MKGNKEQNTNAKASDWWKEADNQVKGRANTGSRKSQSHQPRKADKVSYIAADIVKIKETWPQSCQALSTDNGYCQYAQSIDDG